MLSSKIIGWSWIPATPLLHRPASFLHSRASFLEGTTSRRPTIYSVSTCWGPGALEEELIGWFCWGKTDWLILNILRPANRKGRAMSHQITSKVWFTVQDTQLIRFTMFEATGNSKHNPLNQFTDLKLTENAHSNPPESIPSVTQHTEPQANSWCIVMTQATSSPQKVWREKSEC